uniref:N(6)-L-threonylcarbamoyladenine synthase n=1 Tax=uncultured korarchaeote TaxID=161241 RepID=A0A1L2JME6_9CREN|nr:metal-dependent proteases with possible chaperone activity [uncultured korarchaeote]
MKGEKNIICLGIESTAHTFGVGIVDSRGNIFSNVLSTYRPATGGIHPFEASEHHYKVALATIQKALKEASLRLNNVNLIGFSAGPGLPPCLSIGAVIARTLSIKCNVPLSLVNHCIAHIEIGRLTTKLHDPLTVFVSGVNTQLIVHDGRGYVVIGETQDIGLGNAQDKLGREVGLPFPVGPHLDKISGRWIDLPYTVKGMDLAFSGILTEAIKKLKKGFKWEDVAYSFQEVTFSMLVEAAERALAHTGKDSLLLTGGVAASPRLQEKFRIMCEDRGVIFKVVPKALAIDNGAMIAWTAILSYRLHGGDDLEFKVRPKWRIDSLEWPLQEVGGG